MADTTIAPELLAELEQLKNKVTEATTKAAKAEITEQIKALEEKIKAGENVVKDVADIKVKADERDRRTQKELDEMSAELKQFKQRMEAGNQEKAISREQAILKGLSFSSSLMMLRLTTFRS